MDIVVKLLEGSGFSGITIGNIVMFLIAGILIFLATLWLVIKGGEVVGPNLRLLEQYFIGYTVTIQGACLAFGYAFVWGFLFGWLFAYLRNLILAVYLYTARKKAEMLSLQDFFEHF